MSPRPQPPDEEHHWHRWSCGCATRITHWYFYIVYCKEGCPTYQAVLEETLKNEEYEDPRSAASSGED